MLKHVYHSGSSVGSQSLRGASPAPSSLSVSTDSSSVSASSSLSSPGSIYSTTPETSPSSISANSSTSSFSCLRFSECRTPSRLSILENPNLTPLRVYATGLRADLQFKTVGVTQSTTCEEVIADILNKCKVRFKDPRLFQLAFEVNIRGPNGCNTCASIQLEDSATPLQLQECYPKGQARFCLKMKQGCLVKVFDGSNTAGWLYKSIMISERTTAGELVEILFRYSAKNAHDTKYYTLHIEVDAWKRRLNWEESVIPAQNTAKKWGTPKLILGSHTSHLPTAFLLGNSTTSLYDNVQSQSHSRYRNGSPSPSSSDISSQVSSPESLRSTSHSRLKKWRRSKSFSENKCNTISACREPLDIPFGVSSPTLQHFRNKQYYASLTDSVISGLARLSTRAKKYELAETIIV